MGLVVPGVLLMLDQCFPQSLGEPAFASFKVIPDGFWNVCTLHPKDQVNLSLVAEAMGTVN